MFFNHCISGFIFRKYIFCNSLVTLNNIKLISFICLYAFCTVLKISQATSFQMFTHFCSFIGSRKTQGHWVHGTSVLPSLGKWAVFLSQQILCPTRIILMPNFDTKNREKKKCMGRKKSKCNHWIPLVLRFK